MFGRMSLGSLLVLALAAPAVCLAQSGGGYGPMNGPNGQTMSPYPGQHASQPAGVASPNGGYRNTIFEELPDDRGWLFEDSPLSKSLTNGLRHAFFRAEYLNWGLGDPGRIALGAASLTGADPRIPFNVNDLTTGAPLGVATAPTLDNANLHSNNGFRGTFGVPLGQGAFEASAFTLLNNSYRQDLSNLRTLADPGDPIALLLTPQTFVAQPVLVNGATSIDSLVYSGINDGAGRFSNVYSSILKTSLWGTEANYVFSSPGAGAGDFLTVSPIVGFRYVNYRERLTQRGTYQFSDDGGVTFRDVERLIDASTINNSFGPQVGFRMEAHMDRLTLGVEPKVMLGVNNYEAHLHTQRILSDTETALNLGQRKTSFGPLADLRLFSRFAMTENFSVVASYDLMWLGLVTRPYDNIDYNIAGGAGAFRQTVRHTDVLVEGMTVGVEYKY